MINDWKTQLSATGFEKVDRRIFRRPSVPVVAYIYETPLRVGRSEVRINVAITIMDPWKSNQTPGVLHLRGDVTAEGILVHYNETPYWLRPEEANLVGSVLKDCLASWLSYWCDPKQLIQYFENPKDVIMTRHSPTAGECEHISGVPVKRRSSPHTDYLLSLLYFYVGDFQAALSAAKRYLDFVGPLNSFEGEPDRTKRQIEELSSKF